MIYTYVTHLDNSAKFEADKTFIIRFVTVLRDIDVSAFVRAWTMPYKPHDRISLTRYIITAPHTARMVDVNKVWRRSEHDLL